MPFPLRTVIIRHGESAINKANRLARKGMSVPKSLLDQHNSKCRLTDTGVTQAMAASRWLKKEGYTSFDRYYVSSYIRALETAGHLKLRREEWKIEPYLRERELGHLEMTPTERKRLFAGEEDRRKANYLGWRPPGGQSLHDLRLQLEQVRDDLVRKCGEGTAIIVCHSEIMWMFRALFEELTDERLLHLMRSKRAQDQIHNCQILEYTRINPRDPTTITPNVRWMRSICPWDLTRSSNRWTAIKKQRYSGEALLTIANRHPRFI